jgi:hypothetical protein
MKKLCMLAIIVLSAVMASCTTVPPEAVQLSTVVDNMIAQAKIAHLNTVEYHFDQLALMVDKFAMNEYKPAFLANLRTIMRQRDPNFVDLTPAEYDAAVSRVMTIRLTWLQELWTNKATVMQLVEQFYAQLEQAHKEITNVLRSAANVSASSVSAINQIGSAFSTQAQQLQGQLQNSTNNVTSTMQGALQKVGP